MKPHQLIAFGMCLLDAQLGCGSQSGAPAASGGEMSSPAATAAPFGGNPATPESGLSSSGSSGANGGGTGSGGVATMTGAGSSGGSDAASGSSGAGGSTSSGSSGGPAGTGVGSGADAAAPGSGSSSGASAKDAGAAAGDSGGGRGSSSSSGGVITDGGGPYIFSTFGTRTNTANASKLLIYTSTDGLDFTLLSATGGYTGPTGTLRDPSIMKHTDGRYYVTFTTPPTAGCCGPEASFSIASSPDLMTWTTLTTVSSGLTGTTNTWAPEWFKDADGSTHILVNIDTASSAFQTYDFKALDSTLMSYSGPTPIGITGGYIDTFVLIVGTTYHAFTKNEGENMIEHATASALLGPWTFVGKGDWAGWGAHREAPAVFRLPNGTWRIFMDSGSQGGESYSDSSDGFMTWTPVKSLPTISGLVSHGTVIE